MKTIKHKLSILLLLTIFTFAYADCEIEGDVNDNGIVNIIDVLVMRNYILYSDSTNYICNTGNIGEGEIPNILEIIIIVNIILGID